MHFLVLDVRHAITGWTNSIDLEPDATVADLAKSIIDLGEFNALALPFVSADGLTMKFGGRELKERDASLSDLGVGQQALILQCK